MSGAASVRIVIIAFFVLCCALWLERSRVAEPRSTPPRQSIGSGDDSAVRAGRAVGLPADVPNTFAPQGRAAWLAGADDGGLPRSVDAVGSRIEPGAWVRSGGARSCWDQVDAGMSFADHRCGGCCPSGCGCGSGPADRLSLLCAGPRFLHHNCDCSDLASAPWPASVQPGAHAAACVGPTGAAQCASALTYRADGDLWVSPDAGRQWFPLSPQCQTTAGANGRGGDGWPNGVQTFIGVVAADAGRPGHVVAAQSAAAGHRYDIAGCNVRFQATADPATAGTDPKVSRREIAWSYDVGGQLAASLQGATSQAPDAHRALELAAGPGGADWRFASTAHLAITRPDLPAEVAAGTVCDLAHANSLPTALCQPTSQSLHCHGVASAAAGTRVEQWCPDLASACVGKQPVAALCAHAPDGTCRTYPNGKPVPACVRQANGSCQLDANDKEVPDCQKDPDGDCLLDGGYARARYVPVCDFPTPGPTAIDPRNGFVYMAIATSDALPFVSATARSGLLTSRDGGRTWERFGNGTTRRYDVAHPQGQLVDVADKLPKLSQGQAVWEQPTNGRAVRLLTLQGLALPAGPKSDADALDLNAQPESVQSVGQVAMAWTPCPSGTWTNRHEGNHVRKRGRLVATVAARWSSPVTPARQLSGVFLAVRDHCADPDLSPDEALTFRDTASLAPQQGLLLFGPGPRVGIHSNFRWMAESDRQAQRDAGQAPPVKAPLPDAGRDASTVVPAGALPTGLAGAPECGRQGTEVGRSLAGVRAAASSGGTAQTDVHLDLDLPIATGSGRSAVIAAAPPGAGPAPALYDCPDGTVSWPSRRSVREVVP